MTDQRQHKPHRDLRYAVCRVAAHVGDRDAPRPAGGYVNVVIPCSRDTQNARRVPRGRQLLVAYPDLVQNNGVAVRDARAYLVRCRPIPNCDIAYGVQWGKIQIFPQRHRVQYRNLHSHDIPMTRLLREQKRPFFRIAAGVRSRFAAFGNESRIRRIQKADRPPKV